MNRELQIEQMITQVIQEFSDDLQGYKVVLFGSRAVGKARKRSDFDVGVIGDQPLPLNTFFAIGEALEELPTLHKIDWVDLKKTDAEFNEHACENFKIIFDQSEIKSSELVITK